ncbi:hypothetical protein QDA02_gp13 [Microbacterium phage Margaery]|uniref:Uncharacterized protein n=1 Tax=Microbacterium phage Margaery TaxID=2591217 RepID=A0A514DHR5_9CAUD|nr:hypothetical protein QDA02_gp13 [Microbacterium phage Margaery]QDH93152.1 hypothetical protein PBI_MARGAERY_95 [Microbacterium phage Margaery]
MTVPTRLTLSVSTSAPNIVARTAEQFARAAAGLALDGVETMLMAGPDEEDER